MKLLTRRPLHRIDWFGLILTAGLITFLSLPLHAQQTLESDAMPKVAKEAQGELSWEEYGDASQALLEQHAALNFPGAQTQLGRLAQKSGDNATALQLYRKAVEKDFAPAQVYLGFMYGRGIGVEKDEPEAVNWYRKAAEQGNPFGQYGLAMAYSKGIGVKQDQQEAVRWFRMAAEQNDANAQHKLGMAYAQGAGVEKDDGAAAQWLEKSAAQGHSMAAKGLAMLPPTSDGEELRQLSREQYVAAPQALLEKHAAEGFSGAQTQLGRRAQEAGDYPTAVKLYRKAADQNDADAMYSIGLLHVKGRGVKEDQREAFNLDSQGGRTRQCRRPISTLACCTPVAKA